MKRGQKPQTTKLLQLLLLLKLLHNDNIDKDKTRTKTSRMLGCAWSQQFQLVSFVEPELLDLENIEQQSFRPTLNVSLHFTSHLHLTHSLTHSLSIQSFLFLRISPITFLPPSYSLSITLSFHLRLIPLILQPPVSPSLSLPFSLYLPHQTLSTPSLQELPQVYTLQQVVLPDANSPRRIVCLFQVVSQRF